MPAVRVEQIAGRGRFAAESAIDGDTSTGTGEGAALRAKGRADCGPAPMIDYSVISVISCDR